jgi:ribonuclease HI
MNPLLLFTDGSAHPASQVGYGAYLATLDPAADLQSLANRIRVKRFEATTSTRLEIETLIWALQATQPQSVTVYTDSQNIIGLPDRRERMEKQGYCSKSGAPLNQADLYREFFRLTDSLECTFVKVKGHRRSKEKSRIDQLFTLVDRASRQALRTELASP